MKRIMLAAMNSGAGKTTVTCALLRALTRRGIDAQGYKCGPDYIDPMFHRRVLGVPCENLDVFLQGEAGVLRTLSRQRHEFAVLEGAMGFYDGIGGTERGSAWQIAALSGTPVVLILNPSGIGITLAAQVKGLMEFRTPNHIAALLLNNCSASLYAYLKPILERECGIPVLGYLPKMEDCNLASRHLGLITADEVADFDRRFDTLAQELEKHVDIDRLLDLCADVQPAAAETDSREPICRIAVARDAAFCFYYEENLRALRDAGAELCFFSPLADRELPACDGIYLGGGYPELYAEKLSENRSMLESVRKAAADGMPLIAECGGFLYLQKSLAGLPMAGVLNGEGFATERLQRFGYVTLQAEADSLLFRAGEAIPAHEFHYWDCTENGTDLAAVKANGKTWRCGFCTETMYAAFPHLHFGGALPLAERFVNAALRYKEAA